MIEPDDVLRVLLPATKIPDTATVSKRTGEAVFTLCHSLKLYGTPQADQPMKIEGYFLVGERGAINQIPADRLLHWHVAAEELVDELRRQFEPTPQ